MKAFDILQLNKKGAGGGIWGVDIDTTNSSPAGALTYTDNAVGMTPGSSDWDTTPIFSRIKPCMLKAGVVQYYLDPNDFTKKEDGTSADITSGNDGDVMIEIPKMGYSIKTVGNTLSVKVTDAPNDPNFKYYAHTRDSEGDRDYLYISAYKGYQTGGKLRSLSGKSPTVSQTIGTFRNYAQANGSGYDQLAFYPLTLLQVLFLIRYKNRNSQEALGMGWVGQSAKTNTGGLNTSGMYWGGTDKQQVKFMGIEDIWGNVIDWIDGFYSDSSRNILTGFKSFNNTGSGYTNRGQGATSDIGGNIATVQGDSERGFIIKSIGGSYNVDHYSDYGYLSASCLPVFGGSWSVGAYAGVFRLQVYHSASYSSSHIGGRVMYL